MTDPHAQLPVLVLATNNGHKVEELRALLAGSGWRLQTPRERGLALDPRETGASYAENARIKAESYAHAGACWALADDSGLEVDVLGGAPGVHSARYAGAETPHADKIAVLLRQIAEAGDPRRSARFRAAFVLVAPDGRSWQSEGTWEGEIGTAPRGGEGFGYDPIFLTAGGRTAAEMPADEKNRESHRARAARALLPMLRALAAGATVG